MNYVHCKERSCYRIEQVWENKYLQIFDVLINDKSYGLNSLYILQLSCMKFSIIDKSKQ